MPEPDWMNNPGLRAQCEEWERKEAEIWELWSVKK